MSNKKPYHETFAEKIIDMLEKGTAPWQKPWTPSPYLAPHNPASGTEYKGVNRVNLALTPFEDPRWMTFNQANENGYKIKRGSHATDVVYYQFTKEVDKLDEDGNQVLDENGEPEKEKIRLPRPIVKYSQVFNAEQIEGIPPLEKKDPGPEWNPIERAEKILENSGASIHHDQHDRNFYRPSTDEIHLTPKSTFDSPDKYYATALHELGHWTGHPSRLDREGGPFGSEKYAKEELRAEISSWMLGQDIGIGHDPEQHAAYVDSWIQALKKDPMEIVRACRDAAHIKDYLIDLEMLKEQDKQQEKQAEIVHEQPKQARAAEMNVPAEPAPEKTYLHVPYKEKNLAKARGAKWDRDQKQWFAPQGTDLAPLKRWLEPPERKLEAQKGVEPQEEFAQKLADMGLDLKGEKPILDGAIHRVPVLSKNGKGLDGSYCLHGDGRPAGWAENFVTGEKAKLVASGMILTPFEKTRQLEERAQKQRQAELARKREQDRTAEYCRNIWQNFNPADPDHPYLKEKGVDAIDVKQSQNDALVLPLKNVEGQIRGLQFIMPDGRKSFFPGCEKKGNFHIIGEKEQDKDKNKKTEIVLCEGYATGASLHMATKKPVAVAFDAGNLEVVALKLKEKYPQAQITICADFDHGSAKNKNIKNVGVEKAEKAAKLVGGKVKIPMFTREEKEKGLTDFNDLHKSRGLDVVRKQLGIREQSKDMER